MKLRASMISLLLLAVACPPAHAQSERKPEPRAKQRNMKDDDRGRSRDDVREGYRERQGRPERMSPEERDKLRRDLEEANRQLRRK